MITPLWARCSFTISAGHQFSNRRLTLANLREAMQYAIAYNVAHELKITIGIQALHFQPGLNYLQWGIGITDSATGFVAPAAGRCSTCSGSCCGSSIPNRYCDSSCDSSCGCNQFRTCAYNYCNSSSDFICHKVAHVVRPDISSRRCTSEVSAQTR